MKEEVCIENSARAQVRALMYELPTDKDDRVSPEEFKVIIAILKRALEIAEDVDFAIEGLSKSKIAPDKILIPMSRSSTQ